MDNSRRHFLQGGALAAATGPLLSSVGRAAQSITRGSAEPLTTADMPALEPSGTELMRGFRRQLIRTSGAVINVAIAGDGPPLLLIHGNPLTLVSWHKIAPTLAKTFTVVAVDLRGYGDSSKPDGGLDHVNYTFRAMGKDNFEVMTTLGFENFAVAGHDRGVRVAFRMALDKPSRVTRLASLDVIPTYNLLRGVDLNFALAYPHWFFMAQEAPLPERTIGSDLHLYLHSLLGRGGVRSDIFSPQAVAEYERCTTPEQFHAVCEDYRATVGLDDALDTADFQARRKIACPVLLLWGSDGYLGRRLDTMKSWSSWASDLRGWSVPTGHYIAEQRPDLVYSAFWSFFKGTEPTPYHEL